MSTPVESPFRVLVDTSEQLPYSFAALRADADQGGGPLIIKTTRCKLQSGDYSIEGYERMVAVERKTASDLAGTLTGGRKRFVAEMERLREYDGAWIVVEAELSTLFRGVPFASGFTPKTITRTAMFWQLRYRNIHWWCCPGREIAEQVTYQLLRTWWRERIERPRCVELRKQKMKRRAEK